MAKLILIALLVAGCGGKSGNTNPGDDAGVPDAPPPTCTATGMTCAGDAECCTNHCDALTGTCTHVPGTCGNAGDACTAGPDCCSLSCVGGACSGNQCTSDSQACAADGECCSGTCSNGSCAPLNPGCKTSGNTCTTNAECCSHSCDNGTCSISPSFCTQAGDVCANDAECCGGLCTKAAGATLGTCETVPASGATQCATAGELCGAGADYVPGSPLPTCGGECCSRACFPYGASGALVCQPPSGCRPTGELCTQDTDCCGGPGTPDSASNVRCQKDPGFAVGRCDNGNSCSPAGAICRLQQISCNANADCCAGNVLQHDTCRQDNLGIPRCTIVDGQDCTNPESTMGQTCASSADCCGLPCTPNNDGMLVCGGMCIPTGSTCTNAADCCSGEPCVIPGGATEGTCGGNQGCSELGQTCTMDSDCCNMQPCTNGVCGTIIL